MTRQAIGRVVVDFVADTAKFTQGLIFAENASARFAVKSIAVIGRFSGAVIGATVNVAKLGAGIAALGAVGTGAAGVGFVRWIDGAAQRLDKLGKSARVLGLTTEQMSVLSFAADEAGVEVERFTSSVAKAGKEIAELVRAGERSVQLGGFTVELTDAQGRIRSVVELLPELAQGFSSIENAGERALLADRLFGRAGGEAFLQLLAEMGPKLEGLASAAKRAESLGVIFTQEQVDRATEYRDAVERLEQAWFGLRVELGEQVLPLLQAVAERATSFVSALPNTGRAYMRLLDLQADGSPQEAQLAREVATQLESRGIDALQTYGSELGSILAVSITEGFKTAFITIAPLAEDLGQDIGAAIFNPILQQLGQDPIPRSLRGQLRQLQSVQLEFKDLEVQIATAERLLGTNASRVSVDAMRGMPSSSPSGSAAGGLGTSVGGLTPDRRTMELNLENYRKRYEDIRVKELSGLGFNVRTSADVDSLLQRLPREISRQDDMRTEQRLSQLRESLSAINEQWNESTSAIGESNAAMENWMLLAGEVFGQRENRPRAESVFAPSQQLEFPGLAGTLPGSQVPFPYIEPTPRPPIGEFAQMDPSADTESARTRAMYELQIMRARAQGNEEQAQYLERLQQTRERETELAIEFGPDSDVVQQFREVTQLQEDMLEYNRSLVGSFGNELVAGIKGFAAEASYSIGQWATGAQADFSQVARSFAAMIVEMASRRFIVQPLFDMLGGVVGGMFASPAAGAGSAAMKFSAGANRGAFVGPTGLQYYAEGGWVPGSRALQHDVVPAMLTPGERVLSRREVEMLGSFVQEARGMGGGGATVNVYDQRSSGARVQVQRSSTGGRQTISVIIRDEIARMGRDGSLDKTMGTRYGVTPRLAGQ